MTEKRNMSTNSVPDKPGPHVYHQQQGSCLVRRLMGESTDKSVPDCTICGIGMSDIKALAKIKRILDKGNNVEVKRGKNGMTIMEVRKTIIE